MSTSDPTETPAQALARQIVERLVKEGLLTAQAGAKLQPRLADGKLNGEDWQLPIELGGDKESTE